MVTIMKVTGLKGLICDVDNLMWAAAKTRLMLPEPSHVTAVGLHVSVDLHVSSQSYIHEWSTCGKRGIVRAEPELWKKMGPSEQNMTSGHLCAYTG